MINNPKIEYLKEKAAALPLLPGVYLMKNEAGSIIYVGKSKKLKNRVSSYFIDTEHGIKTQRMVSQVRDFDTIICKTEIEALTLENTLIKKHTPKYNINLKDSKSYPYIKITGEPFPKIIMSRERRDDGATYLGPYSGTGIVYDAIETVQKIFRLPTCKRSFPRDIGKERPCIYRQMGRCMAPCTGEISQKEYLRHVESARHVLSGNIKKTSELLTREMYAAAEEERFEEAARLRDTVNSLKALKEKQKVVIDTDSLVDIWAVYTCDFCGVITVLSVRDGALNSKNDFLFPKAELLDDAALVSFMFNYYTTNTVPPKIALAGKIEDEALSLLSDFTATLGKKTEIRIPQRGALRSLCDMALANARERADKHVSDSEKADMTLARLASLCSLEALPERIEAYDISNLGTEHITAGMIVFENGAFKKSDYRRFKITDIDGTDDYASMREAISRRLSHIDDGSPSLGEEPDLILLDGGKGHVNAVREVINSLGYGHIPLFGMVKDDYHKTRELTDGENDIGIAHENSVFVMLYKIQEEVHRYTVTSMHSAKRRDMRRSRLEDIAGIGKIKAKKLLLRFGSIKRIAEMSEQELLLSGLSAPDAHNIAEYFKSDKEISENDENNNG